MFVANMYLLIIDTLIYWRTTGNNYQGYAANKADWGGLVEGWS